MRVRVIEVTTSHLYRNEKSSSSRIFAGVKVLVKLEDGTIIRFKTDHMMLQPRRVITDVVSHVFTRSGLPDGVSGLVVTV
jgi:hypothetical protein